MSQILLYYRRPDPTTWVYMSSFLTIGLFFVFHRFWSIRNLDVFLLILLAPGLLVVHEGYRRQLIEAESVARQKQEPPRPEQTTKAVTSLFSAFPILSIAPLDGPSSIASDNSIANDDSLADDDSIANDSLAESAEPVGESSEEADRSAGPVPQYSPTDIRRWGFIYLFFVEALLMLRLMLDPLMVRRPLLDPNLTTGGLNFIGISLFIFMMANVVASNPRIQVTQGPELGPGYAMMNMLPSIPTRPVSDELGGASPPTTAELTASQTQLAQLAKALAILAHLAIVTGIVLIGNRHFSNLRAGVGCATLYLILPYTAQMTGRVDHALPAALLLWAVLCYRKPLIAGIFLGLAGGLVYYPLFLLPLWISFYWKRGVRPFVVGVVVMLGMLVVALSFDNSTTSLTEHLQQMFGLLNPNKEANELSGIWGLGWNPIWRLPVIVAFVILSVFFAIWPAQKNLGTLMTGSAAVMVAAQFWHGYGGGGGLYIAWFLPLLLLTIFRPNLQDRIATKVVVAKSNRFWGSQSEISPV
ncbi:MAG: hypothetical protein AB8B91_04090 [Rubripirellula sp.]